MKDYPQLQTELLRAPRRWLITGVAGFIGSHLLEALLRLNQTVLGLDNFSTGKQQNLTDVLSRFSSASGKRFHFIEGDIRDPETCGRACQGADYILHQAALGSVPRSVADPIATNDNNVTGFLNLLVAARDARVRRLIYASSSSVYGDSPELPKSEARVGEPLSPYALTKRINELYAAVFARHYGLESIGLRYFNVFGPRQNPDSAYAAVIPRWATAMIRNTRCHINGDGSTSRDFCYVANAVQANLLAADAEHPAALNQVFNVATHAQHSLNELFELMRRKLQPDFPHLRHYPAEYREFRAGDIRHSLADISRARQLLGYEPTHTLETGLDETLAWYKTQVCLEPEGRPEPVLVP